uniref:Uncharacterized protein n=1 Tax=Arundo donax TaxID=35708 RepID=A0A0A9SKE8_ARUDO
MNQNHFGQMMMRKWKDRAQWTGQVKQTMTQK